MQIGVSTASLYPLHLEDSFSELAQRGVKNIEVFANSTCEGQEPYISMIKEIQDANGIAVTSFHPFSSPMESVFLFSTYDRRVEEMLTMYRGFFQSMQKLGARIFVLHGAIKSSKCTTEHYIKQFRLLAEVGREYGITVAQENVCYCLSGSIDFLRMMKKELGEYANFVLDLKQARRSGEDVFSYIDALGDRIIHCHISDGNDSQDCLPIGEGDFDFKRLCKAMEQQGYKGAYIVELYRQNYSDFDQLCGGVERFRELVGG